MGENSYHVVKRIGEGGKLDDQQVNFTVDKWTIFIFLKHQGFSYVDLVTSNHSNYALVSVQGS